MNTGSDKTLEFYLQKLMEIRYRTESEKPLNETELKNIALEAGLTEQEYEASKQKARETMQRGKGHLEAYNWKDAAAELEQAAMLMPHSAEANRLAGKAFLRKGSSTGDKADLEKSEYFLNQSIVLQPSENEALALKGELNRQRESMKTKSEGKKKMSNILKWGVPAFLILIFFIWYIGAHNTMVEKEEQTINSWAQVENVYQRRADLIPNLVRTVQAAADFERETLNDVIEARAAATSIQVDPAQLSEGVLRDFEERQQNLSASLGRFLAVAEGYPALQSVANFRDLQTQIEGSENRIAVERRRFNESIRDYNTLTRRFPYSFLGFDPKPYFSTDEKNMETPEVNIN